MEESNVIDITEAQARRAEGQDASSLMADGTDLVIQQKAMVLPALSTEAHMIDLLVTSGMGAAIGFLAQPSMQGAGIGALAGVAFGLAEKALLGQSAGVNPEHRVAYAVLALGTTFGAGYLSYRFS